MITAALVGYLSSVLSIEDMTIFYRASNLLEVGRGKLAITFSISNMGRQGALIEELGLIQLVGEKIDRETENCQNAELLSEASYIQPGEQLQRKTHNLLSYHVPTNILVDDRRAVSGSVALNAGTAKKVDTIFDLPSFDRTKSSAVLCPVIKYFDRAGHSIQSICLGWVREAAADAISQEVGNDSLRLLPQQGSFLNLLFWRHRDLFCNS